MASRVTKTQLPLDFYHDWLGVADDEARHFLMLSDRLADLGGAYADLPPHDGLWQAADASEHDLLARLAIAPLLLEARGLDVTSTMIDRLKSVGDEKTANALGIIMTDEITHVSVGKRWFDYMCGMDHLDTVSAWHSLVKRYFHGDLNRHLILLPAMLPVFQRRPMARLPQEMICWRHPKKGKTPSVDCQPARQG